MMKKMWLFVVLLVAMSICGCSALPKEIAQTNKSLTIFYYGTDFGATSDVLNAAVTRYRQNYPEVEVKVERVPYSENDDGDEAYYQKLATEVMAGKGPDVFWIELGYMDVYKMMDAGAFADLRDHMDGDPSFRREDYQQVVLDGGIYKGHQYIMPLDYSVSGLISEKAILEKAGFRYAQCDDYFKLWEELERYSTEYLAEPSLILKPLRLTLIENTQSQQALDLYGLGISF